MILTIAAAIALSAPGGNVPSTRSDTTPGPVSAPSTAEANPSPYRSRDVNVGPFDTLKVSGPFKVGVFVSDEPARVRLLGPPTLLADAVVEVEGGILTIRFREGAAWSWNPGSGVNVVVAAPKLASVNLEGAADVEVLGVQGESLAALTQGSGSLKATGINVERIHLATRGAGSISVEGSAREATYEVGGSGSIDAMRLKVESARIAVGGAGSSYANVSRTATVSVNGNGRVEVVGGATCISQPVHSRQIECR